MNGTHLTLTLAAALAAAGALSRHGSRSTFPSAEEVRSANNSFFDALGRLAGEQQLFFMGPFVIVGDRKGGVLGRLEVRVGMSAVASGLCVRLGFLGVGKDERREGRGGRLLQMVCDAADEVGLPVELDVSPQKQHGQSKAPMNKVQLRDFYGKFGFQKVKRMGADFMRREAGAGSRAGSPARRLADGLPAQAEGFRWRRIGAGEFILEREDPAVVITTRERDSLAELLENGWRQLAKLSVQQRYGEGFGLPPTHHSAVVGFLLTQKDDGSLTRGPPKTYSSVERCARALERLVGAPKMEILRR